MIYDRKERSEMLKNMQAASDVFYRMARMIGCHPFIEFAGLMNEYIKICEIASAGGIDFNETSVHGSGTLPMESYNVEYIVEKLRCIYGNSINLDVLKAVATRIDPGVHCD